MNVNNRKAIVKGSQTLLKIILNVYQSLLMTADSLKERNNSQDARV